MSSSGGGGGGGGGGRPPPLTHDARRSTSSGPLSSSASGVAVGSGSNSAAMVSAATAPPPTGLVLGRSSSAPPLHPQDQTGPPGQGQHYCSQVPGRPSFRSAALNGVAIVPLLSTGSNDGAAIASHSQTSFVSLMNSLRRFAQSAPGDEPEMSHAMQMRLGNGESDGGDGEDGNGESGDDDDEAGDGGGGGDIASSSSGRFAKVPRWAEEQSEMVLVVPNAQLTRPGDWRYDATPLRSHDWSNGCQRIKVFDGRPDHGRMAHDRLVNPVLREDWTDLIPSRGTAAVIGVLNVRDCPDTDALHRAEQELQTWADRYANINVDHDTTHDTHDHGHAEENTIIRRMFVFDSFDEQSQKNVDLTSTHLGSNLVAFPPSDAQHTHMMDLHLNVVVNDLAVAIFRQLEGKIRSLVKVKVTSNFFGLGGGGGGGGGGNKGADSEPAGPTSPGLSISAIANIVNPGNALLGSDNSGHGGSNSAASGKGATAASGGRGTNDGGGGGSSHGGSGSGGGGQENGVDKSSSSSSTGSGGGIFGLGAAKEAAAMAARAVAAKNMSASSLTLPSPKNAGGTKSRGRLVTPLDDAYNNSDPKTMTSKEIDALSKRDAGRREKLAADLSLLAGSPIDAYERYTHAAELTKASQDPLWYAASLEGCAASFIAMADAGGHGVDEYLENNFQLPEDIMALLAAGGTGGVDGGAGGGSGRGSKAVDRTKTTLPAAVFALTDEALSIMSRHPKLGPLYAELLLKLAWYAAEIEESHLRCRWGEGEACYGGDTVSGGGLKRWQTTTVSSYSQAGLDQLLRGSAGALLGDDSIARCQKFTNLLHRAVSAGAIDHRTRADVAATAARMCLIGVKATQWDNDTKSPYARLRLPRKAAFFTTVAAESMAQASSSSASSSDSGDPDSHQRAASLWTAACHLYSRDSNSFDGMSNYAWATLRASALYALSQQSDQIAAEVAAELLLVLLSEISPDRSGDASILSNYPSRHEDDRELSNQSGHGRSESEGPGHALSSIDQQAANIADAVDQAKASKHARAKSGLQARTSFFAQAAPSVQTVAQSKWLDDEPIPDAQVLASSLVSLNSVAQRTRFETSAMVQKRCLINISELRQGMPTPSRPVLGEEDVDKRCSFSVYSDSSGSRGASAEPPLEVVSAKIVKSESHLLLERAKAHGFSSKANAGMSMATFFNPYANKKKEGGDKVQSTLVAEGEERTILIEFANKLSVPLDIPSCELEFETTGTHAIEAPPLSFTIPPKTKDFAVHFPVIVVASKADPSKLKSLENGDADKDEDGSPQPDQLQAMLEIFELVGLRVMCLNRTLSISFKDSQEAQDSGKDDSGAFSDKHIAQAASVYQRSKHNRPKKEKERVVVRLEGVPAQPNLLVSFETSQTPLEDEAMVPVHLSDGEIYTIPSFRLENDFGPSGMGKMERLQIVGVGLPGLPDEVLFDTDALAAAREAEEDILTDTESDASSEDFEEMMECDGLPPLKMKALTGGLSLKSINDKSKQLGEGSLVTFQIAATHDMGNQLANGGNVRIRFRYRGPSPNPATEIWRKREVSLRIVRVKGPRISSLTFRSDLSWGSAYSELCRSLAQQKLQWEAVPKWETSKLSRHVSRQSSYSSTRSASDMNPEPVRNVLGNGDEPIDESILYRVGMDQGVHVSGDEVVVLMAVANETNSTIILSNRKGLVGGFEGSPMPTVRVTSGVSVKIPVVIPRIERIDEENTVMDIAAELITRTALQWESEASEGDDNVNKRVRQGRVRIPSRCLREIIDEHKSFGSRICKSPVFVKVSLGQQASGDGEKVLSPGSSIEAFVEARIHDWVPTDVASKLSITLEFCCARRDSGSSALAHEDEGNVAYIWCGQLRRTVGADEDMNHRARVTFLRSGVFVVSACAKISCVGWTTDESWWAPHARTVTVEKEEAAK